MEEIKSKISTPFKIFERIETDSTKKDLQKTKTVKYKSILVISSNN